MGQKIAGTCSVKVDGIQLVLTGNVEAPLAEVKNETIVPGYFKVEDVPPFLKAEFLVPKGMNIQKIVKGTNMTITTDFANGTSYVLSAAYPVGEATYSSEEGKVSMEFNGDKGDWS